MGFQEIIHAVKGLMRMNVAGADSDGGGWDTRLFQVGCPSIGSPFGAVVLILDAGFFGCCEQEVPHIGQEDMARVIAAYDAAGIAAEVQPFFNDVPRRLSEAQLVISRAGASSVADISVIGRPAILIPYAAATGDHQTANARGLVDAGGAILIPEARLDPETLAEQVALVLDNPAGAVQMAHSALNYGIHDATARLVDLVEALARKTKT